MAAELSQRVDGTYEETLGAGWRAEYREDPETGLWEVLVSHHDTAEWRESGYATLEESRRVAAQYYDQL